MLEIFMTKGAIAAGVVGAFSLLLTATGIFPNTAPIVTIENGPIQGRLANSRSGQQYVEYLGIPMAEPPVNELRFEPPVPLRTNWTEVRQTTSYPPFCLQFDAMVKGRLLGVEDCLYLNVFTHNPTPEKKKPVLVYIHGGGFLSGTSSMYGPYFFMDEDIVLVTINYRLGPLGFLSTGDEIQGNMGLKDQNVAMKWVKRNIAQFGGDVTKITLFGESAGAASVLYHILSPASAGLFHRAIAQSGSILSPWSFTESPRKVVEKYAPLVNCPVKNETELVACLKTIDVSELVKLQKNVMDPTNEFLAFVPTLETVKKEDTFLTENPRALYTSGKLANRVPLLLGVTSGEGALRTARFDAMPELIPLIDEEWDTIGPKLISMEPFPGQEETLEKIRQYYFGEHKFTEDLHEFKKNFSKMNSDGLFFQSVRKSAIVHANLGLPTYLYYYDYNSAVVPSMYSLFRAVRPDDWIFSEAKLGSAVLVDFLKENVFGSEGPHEFGATHADDLFQLWNLEGWTAYISGGDEKFSKNFVKAFVDFARDEDALEFNGVPWPPVSQEEAKSATPLKYMLLGNESKMINEPFEERVKFWESLRIPGLH